MFIIKFHTFWKKASVRFFAVTPPKRLNRTARWKVCCSSVAQDKRSETFWESLRHSYTSLSGNKKISVRKQCNKLLAAAEELKNKRKKKHFREWNICTFFLHTNTEVHSCDNRKNLSDYATFKCRKRREEMMNRVANFGLPRSSLHFLAVDRSLDHWVEKNYLHITAPRMCTIR